VTKCVCEKIAQNVTHVIFIKIYLKPEKWKRVAQNFGLPMYCHNVQKTAQRKQSPNRRKVAQSGHLA
jgi:hypothetical protein